MDMAINSKSGSNTTVGMKKVLLLMGSRRIGSCMNIDSPMLPLLLPARLQCCEKRLRSRMFKPAGSTLRAPVESAVRGFRAMMRYSGLTPGIECAYPWARRLKGDDNGVANAFTGSQWKTFISENDMEQGFWLLFEKHKRNSADHFSYKVVIFNRNRISLWTETIPRCTIYNHFHNNNPRFYTKVSIHYCN